MSISAVGLAILLSLGVPAPAESLRETIDAYWLLLSRGDKAEALQLVTPGSRNAFILRREPPFQTWSVVEVKPDGEGRYTVAVDLGQGSARGSRPHRIVESWVLQGGRWKVSLENVKPAISPQALWKSPLREPTAGRLRVLPEIVRIHFVGANRTGNLVIENGLDEEVKLERIDFDEERFELKGRPETVRAGGVARLSLRYIGAENEKSLESSIALTLRHGSSVQRFESSIRYNIVSRGARALFGLTRRETDALRRGDTLKPRRPPTDPTQQDVHPRTMPAPKPGSSANQEI